jgi:hypothetical protein
VHFLFDLVIARICKVPVTHLQSYNLYLYIVRYWHRRKINQKNGADDDNDDDDDDDDVDDVDFDDDKELGAEFLLLLCLCLLSAVRSLLKVNLPMWLIMKTSETVALLDGDEWSPLRGRKTLWYPWNRRKGKGKYFLFLQGIRPLFYCRPVLAFSVNQVL